MTKYLLLAFLLFSVPFFSSAQVSVSISPVNPRATVLPDSPDVAARATVKNNASQAKTFFWHRTVLSQSSGWANTVCDKNFCYPGTVNVKQFTLAGGEEARLDVHIYAKGIDGKASIDLKVTEVGNETNSAVAHYMFNFTPPTPKTDKNALSVYPNPAKDFFYISENDLVHTVTIYNVLGKPIRAMRTANGLKYDISDLPEGLYLIRMTAANGTTLKTVRLNKQREKA